MGFNIGDLYELHTRLIASQDTSPQPDPEPLPEPDAPTSEPWMLLLMLFVCACVIVALVYSLVHAPISAQEVSTMEGIISIQEAGNILMGAIAAIAISGAASPLTEPVVSLAKLILKLLGWEKKVTGDTINLLVSLGIVLVAFVSRNFGVELQTQTVFDWLIELIPWVISGLTFFIGHKAVYQKAQALNLKFWNYQRSA